MSLATKNYETYSRELDEAVDDLWKSSNTEDMNNNRNRIAKTIREEAEEMRRYARRRAEKINS